MPASSSKLRRSTCAPAADIDQVHYHLRLRRHTLSLRQAGEVAWRQKKGASCLIHPSAIVEPGAILGEGVTVGPFSIIHANVQLGAGSSVGSHCELGVPAPGSEGSPLQIGANAVIRSHSVFYAGSTFGERLTTGHRVTIREKTVAGVNLQVGTLGDIQGHCEIGDYVRFHSNVHIGKHSVVEDFVWIFPYVVLTNDPHPPSEVQMGVTLRKFCAIATMTTILPGVEVGAGALVGAHSNVAKSVPPHRVVAGNPAIDRGPTERIRLKDGTERPAYPWTTHFTRGYPDEVVRRWAQENGA